MPVAITRPISPKLAECELTYLDRKPIEIHLAKEQHRVYENALEKMGYTIRLLPKKPDLPDGVFVEDTAVVFPERAIITRPGAESRRPETESMAKVLQDYRDLSFIKAPATLDGGDVFVLGKHIFIGLSKRSNGEAVRQVDEIMRPLGYRVSGIPVRHCLHLKTAVARIEDDLMLINPKWLSPAHFPGIHCEPVHPDEPYGTNVMRRDKFALTTTAFPYTAEWLARRGYDLIVIDQSELAKAEAGLTCSSVIVEDNQI
ncbi:MAG: hypothetical protein JJU46_05870 [Balneolaceae bacterium]|nr:hypothetical protein [Balneolaceae bacterium]